MLPKKNPVGQVGKVARWAGIGLLGCENETICNFYAKMFSHGGGRDTTATTPRRKKGAAQEWQRNIDVDVLTISTVCNGIRGSAVIIKNNQNILKYHLKKKKVFKGNTF